MNWITVLNPYIKKKIGFAVMAVILVTLEVILGSFQPRLVAQIIDIGIQQNRMDYVMRMGAIMLVICIAGYVTGVLATIISGKISAEIGHKIRNDVFSRILHGNMQQNNSIKKQYLFNIISGDCGTLMEFLAELIHICVKPLLLFAAGLVMLFLVNPTFSWVMLAAIAAELAIMLLLYKKTASVFAKLRKKIDGLINVLRQNIIGARAIKIFSREKKQRIRFFDQNQEIEKESLEIWRFTAKMNAIVMMVMNTVILLVLMIGGLQAQHQTLKIGEILASITYSQQVMMSMMSFGIFFRYMAEANIAIGRLERVLQLEPERLHTQRALDQQIEEITFENVSFCHEGTYKLQNISFTVRKGEMVGFLGETASGKTLLIDLLTGIYTSTSGNIFINGINICQFTPESLRAHIAVAMQEDGIFSDTIEENIAWGRRGDLMSAVRFADAEALVEHTSGKFRTHLFDKGANLSGGQRKKLQMARAFYSDAEVLVVDDVVSQIDAAGRKQILDNVRRDKKRNIVILTAQRPSVLRDCACIFVVQGGQIIASGDHEKLLSECRLYRTFCNLQGGVTDET